ncbi:Chloroperoxidase [Lasiodiplodia theobromae]|uniref:Chloroperoxidase n=1 Tax=Lasiodiplodia theobromae TaxID=45133 RepID=UPI0015C3FE0C|nr:Chloroperoxidase [Lasiodiplodia theobromae]KAF4542401.1 Chloroperoxidase [Lasiodiplodia theobromae]KAF9635863.1 Chloroperoxidase [Lasiodiplodia theobromae]
MPSSWLSLGAAALAGQAAAFPALADQYAAQSSQKEKRVNGISPGFDAEAQRIDVSGEHAFVPPGPGDKRGPCPGLNALANHNYLPHDGVATITQFVEATNQVYGMGVDLATFLSIYGAVMDGNGISWSIGGAPETTDLLNLLTQPQGISGSHNKYETDASPTRGDLYQYGNNFAVVRSQWDALFAKQSGVPNAQSNYGLGLLTDFREERFQQSISSNPYFFNAPFSGVVVQPAAYTFIYRFMANKSAENPEGVLTKEVLKSFFGFTGPDDDMVHNPGWERIPENWYKRALGDEYTIPFYALDLNAAALQHPQFLDIGGNTGTPNSFTPIDLQNLTGGLYNAQTLLDGNNLACFGFQAAVQFAPDLLKGLVKDLAGALGQLGDALTSAISGLGCPQLGGEAWDEGSLAQFPGWTKLKDDGTYP